MIRNIYNIEEIKIVPKESGYEVDFVVKNKPFSERHNTNMLKSIEMLNLESAFSLDEPRGILFRFKKPYSCVILGDDSFYQGVTTVPRSAICNRMGLKRRMFKKK